MTFEEKVARLRKYGTVEGTDWFPSKGSPYRLAIVKSEPLAPDKAIVAASVWMGLAFEVDGYFTVCTFQGTARLQINISRELTAAEIGDNPPIATRPVSP